MKPSPPTRKWYAAPTSLEEDLWSADGQYVATACPDGLWVLGCPASWGRADPPTLEAAKAAVEAELWARAAQGLVGR